LSVPRKEQLVDHQDVFAVTVLTKPPHLPSNARRGSDNGEEEEIDVDVSLMASLANICGCSQNEMRRTTLGAGVERIIHKV
jgi:hypothetical protein